MFDDQDKEEEQKNDNQPVEDMFAGIDDSPNNEGTDNSVPANLPVAGDESLNDSNSTPVTEQGVAPPPAEATPGAGQKFEELLNEVKKSGEVNKVEGDKGDQVEMEAENLGQNVDSAKEMPAAQIPTVGSLGSDSQQVQSKGVNVSDTAMNEVQMSDGQMARRKRSGKGKVFLIIAILLALGFIAGALYFVFAFFNQNPFEMTLEDEQPLVFEEFEVEDEFFEEDEGEVEEELDMDPKDVDLLPGEAVGEIDLAVICAPLAEGVLDSDGDGLSDEVERMLGTDPFNPDTDNDGLTDYEEVCIYGTDPLNPDTDGDGYLDGEEVAAGYNPLGPGRLLEIPDLY